MATAWIFFAGLSVCCVLISSIMTIYWGPGANGSGVAELIGYLNGINYPNVLGFETYVTKVFGVVLAVVGGLCVGKEGPLAHIGANIGAAVTYLPLPRFAWLKNDTYKRYLIAAGTSAGVSAAFGAPVGGALFAFEISKPNIFWKFSVIWKVFFSCALSVFTLTVVSSLMKGEDVSSINGAVLKFGVDDISPSTFEVLPGSLIVGAVTGLLGGVFVVVNSNLGLVRKKLVTANWMKLLEACLFSFMTTTCFFWSASFFNECYDSADASNSDDILVNYDCPDGQYSPLATMFMNTEGDAIRSIINGFEGPGGVYSYNWNLAYFAAMWYFWTIVTYGVWVPAGLFLPGIIIGCAVGGVYGQIEAEVFGNTIADTWQSTGGSSTACTFVLVGAGAMLSGYCRLTYSLVVIMLETTSSINIFLPMMIGIMTARACGNLISPSLYDRALRMKQMPFLRADCPESTKYLKASVIMAKDPVTLPTIANMGACKLALQSHHNAYPVVNTAGRLVGLIPKRLVVKILEKKAFYDKERIDRSQLMGGHTDQAALQYSLNDDGGKSPLLGGAAAAGGFSGTTSEKAGHVDEWDLDYDAQNGFPETPESKRLTWHEFFVDIYSTEADATDVIDNVIEDCHEEWIDLRPYMIESPMTVSVHDKFYRVLEQFRINHCRHMMVIDPANGALRGVITRKDIFSYNHL